MLQALGILEKRLRTFGKIIEALQSCGLYLFNDRLVIVDEEAEGRLQM